MNRPPGTVIFVTGKGGVGKSSAAAALAWLLAEQGSCRLVELEGATGARRLLGDTLPRQLQVVDVSYAEALEEGLASLFHSRPLARLLIGHRAVARLIRAVPALRELMELERIRRLAQQGGTVVVDLPATGHALEWLRVPAAAVRFLRLGPAAEFCRRLQSEVIAAERTRHVVITTTEGTVLLETMDLCRRFRQEQGRDPDLIWVNRVPVAPTPATLCALEAPEVGRVYAPLRAIGASRLRDSTEYLGLRRQLADAAVTWCETEEFPSDPSALEMSRSLPCEEIHSWV